MKINTPRENLVSLLAQIEAAHPEGRDAYLCKLILALPLSMSCAIGEFVYDLVRFADALTSPDTKAPDDWKNEDGKVAARGASPLNLQLGTVEVRAHYGTGDAPTVHIYARLPEHPRPVFAGVDVTPYDGGTLLADMTMNAIHLAVNELLRRVLTDLAGETGPAANTPLFRMIQLAYSFEQRPAKGWKKSSKAPHGRIWTDGTGEDNLTIAIVSQPGSKHSAYIIDPSTEKRGFPCLNPSNEYDASFPRAAIARQAIVYAFRQCAKLESIVDPRYNKETGDPITL